MTYALAPEQIDQYQRDGFLFPLDVFDNNRVVNILEQLEHTRTVAREQGLESELTQLLRTNTHYILPFVSEMVRAPQLLDRVESILGPNILLWSAEFFIKDAHTDKIVSWHQDLTYWGLGETNQEMTAWLALSDVNVVSGCMRFVAGSHHQQIVPHRDTFDAANLLSRGQEVAVDVAEDDAVDVILDPGQVSFHHGRMFHASGPNRSARDRIGLAFRFITPEVKQLVAITRCWFEVLTRVKTGFMSHHPRACSIQPSSSSTPASGRTSPPHSPRAQNRKCTRPTSAGDCLHIHCLGNLD